MIFKSFGIIDEQILAKSFVLLYGENLSLILEIENNILNKIKEKKNF